MVIGYGGSYVGHYVSSTNTEYSVGEYWTDDQNAINSWIAVCFFLFLQYLKKINLILKIGHWL